MPTGLRVRSSGPVGVQLKSHGVVELTSVMLDGTATLRSAKALPNRPPELAWNASGR